MSKSGPVTAIGEPLTEAWQEGLVRVSVPVVCARGGLTVIMSVNSAGKLHGLRLAAPAGLTSWLPPAYANPQVFAEQEVTLAPGSLIIGGTLTLPDTRGPLPGVALLSGGGPFNRDETSGLNETAEGPGLGTGRPRHCGPAL